MAKVTEPSGGLAFNLRTGEVYMRQMQEEPHAVGMRQRNHKPVSSPMMVMTHQHPPWREGISFSSAFRF